MLLVISIYRLLFLLFWGFIIAEFALVVFLSSAITKIDYSTAAITFTTYSILNGITLSSIFVAFELPTIFSTLLVTAGMFAGLAIYGYVTKTDLTTVGSIARMLLWGLILGYFVNFFLRSSHAEMMFSFIGVIVFSLLTAYDVQKIKGLYIQLHGSGNDMRKISLVCALTLYLDFINLFLFLLRFTGRRRN